MEKLITAKKTDLLTAFVSQRTRRKFSAYLVMAEDGKTSFAFEPRKEGAGKKPFGRRNFPAKAAAPTGEPSEAEPAKPAAKSKKSRARKKSRGPRSSAFPVAAVYDRRSDIRLGARAPVLLILATKSR